MVFFVSIKFFLHHLGLCFEITIQEHLSLSHRCLNILNINENRDWTHNLSFSRLMLCSHRRSALALVLLLLDESSTHYISDASVDTVIDTWVMRVNANVDIDARCEYTLMHPHALGVL